MATTTRGKATEADLLNQPDDGYKYELVDGEILRLSPATPRHGRVCVNVLTKLSVFVGERRLGLVFEGQTGFRLPGGNVRSPDVSFVAAARLEGVDQDDFASLAPDLAIEVLSPSDRPRYILDKVGEFLEAGVRLVWVIDPKNARAVIHRSTSEARELGADDFLDGEDVLPGFHCRLGDVLQ
jgi:Uma2 family endonuclease